MSPYSIIIYGPMIYSAYCTYSRVSFYYSSYKIISKIITLPKKFYNFVNKDN